MKELLKELRDGIIIWITLLFMAASSLLVIIGIAWLISVS